jgi:hypothetical protein
VAGELDSALAGSLGRVARELSAGPHPGRDGRARLRAALSDALGSHVGRLAMVIPGDTVRVAGWPGGIAVIDLAVRGRLAGRQRAVVACAWLAGDEGRRRAARDACLVASAVREGAGDGYLVAGVPPGPAAPALLADGERATLALLREAGVESLADGPVVVPGRLRVHRVAAATATVGGAACELRAVRVAPAGGDLSLG